MSHTELVYPPESIWRARRLAPEPVAFLQRLAEEADIVPFVLAGNPAFLLNHPDHIEEVLVRNHSKVSKPRRVRRSSVLLGTGLFTAEGELHRQRRHVVHAAFGPSRMEGYGQTIVECARRLEESWADGAIVDMASEMRSLAVEVVGRILFGVDLSDQAADIGCAVSAVSALDPLLSFVAPTRRVRPAARHLRDLVNGLIDRRMAAGRDGDDMLSVLRRADTPDGATVTDQLRDDVLTLFVAGHDTIANALVWTWYLLSEHPEAECRLHEELSAVLQGRRLGFDHVKALVYTGRVLSESMRLYPPAWIITRRSKGDLEIGGIPIPVGAIIIMSQYLVHRDERFFPDPLAFKPERWQAMQGTARPGFAYFPFGAGPRGCIGQALGTVEGILTVAAIASHWRCRSLAPIDCDPRVTLRPRGPVPMRVRRSEP